MQKTILIVDDEQDVRDSVKMILEANGYKVETAVNGDDCLKKLEKITPDLILLDIMMPGKPVEELIKDINDIKIAFMSVIRISEARKNGLCKKENVVDFLQKPFNISDLVNRVGLLLEK